MISYQVYILSYYNKWGKLNLICNAATSEVNNTRLLYLTAGVCVLKRTRNTASSRVQSCSILSHSLWYDLNLIIYHDFLPTPRRGSHVKSDKTNTQSSRLKSIIIIIIIIIIIYHDFLPPPMKGSHVKSDNTHTIIQHIHP